MVEEDKLDRDSVVAFFATTASEGKTYNVEHRKYQERTLSRVEQDYLNTISMLGADIDS